MAKSGQTEGIGNVQLTAPIVTKQHVAWGRLAFYTLIFVCVLARIAPIFGTEEQLATSITDDAYYYLKPAENIVEGHGSTFDGINPTNGYHPLWMVVVVALRIAFAPLDRTAFLRVVLTVQMGIWLGSLWLIWSILTRVLSPLASRVGLSVFMLTAFGPITGLETPLVVFGIAFACWCIVTKKSVLWVSAALSIISLSRLDYTLIALALGVYWAWKRPWRDWMKVFALPTVLGMGYLAFNILAFGNLLPISAVIKSGHIRFSIPDAYREHAILLAIAGIGILIGWFPSLRLKTSGDPLRRLAIVLFATTTLHLAYMSFNGSASFWHTMPYSVIVAFGIGYLVEYLGFYSKTVAYVLAAGFFAFTVIFNASAFVFTYISTDTYIMARLYRVSLWIRENTPPDSHIFLGDAGLVGYFSDRTVINADGLVNSFAYYHAIQAGTACALLQQWGIDYVMYITPVIGNSIPVDRVFPDGSQLPLGTQRYLDTSDGEYQVGLWDYNGCE